MLLLSDGQMNSMGVSSFDAMKKQTPQDTNPKTHAYVQCIADAITREAHDSTGVDHWEVVVFKDDSANAFALPGGKIGVHTGILKVAKNQDQLATVLGHEVGHVIARHGNERVSTNLAAQLGLVGVGVALQDNKNQNLIMAGLGLGATVGLLLPHSRSHESEADSIGLDLMARAGFNPKESVPLWQNMKAAGGGKQPEFLSTHPSNENRISNLQARIPAASSLADAAHAAGKNPSCGSPF